MHVIVAVVVVAVIVIVVIVVIVVVTITVVMIIVPSVIMTCPSAPPKPIATNGQLHSPVQHPSPSSTSSSMGALQEWSTQCASAAVSPGRNGS